MLRTILTLALMVACFAVLADARIEIDNPNGNGIANTVHLPWNAANTDDEYKVAATTASAYEEDSTGTYQGYYSDTVVLPVSMIFPDLKGKKPFEVTSGQANETGALQVDGTDFTCASWIVSFQRKHDALKRTIHLWDCTKD
jgi:hypothetical protein